MSTLYENGIDNPRDIPMFPRHARIPIRVYSTLHIDFDTLNEFHITKREVHQLFPIGGLLSVLAFRERVFVK